MLLLKFHNTEALQILQVEQLPESNEKHYKRVKNDPRQLGQQTVTFRMPQNQSSVLSFSHVQTANCDQHRMGHVPTFKSKKGMIFWQIHPSGCLQLCQGSSPEKTKELFSGEAGAEMSSSGSPHRTSINTRYREGILMQLKISFPLWLLQSLSRNLRHTAEQFLFNCLFLGVLDFFNAIFVNIICKSQPLKHPVHCFWSDGLFLSYPLCLNSCCQAHEHLKSPLCYNNAEHGISSLFCSSSNCFCISN